jgi:hypothetical protein
VFWLCGFFCWLLNCRVLFVLLGCLVGCGLWLVWGCGGCEEEARN